MSNYILDNTASDINTALGKVLSPDTSPTPTDALITSGGVKTYVEGEVSALDTRITTVEAEVAGLPLANISTASVASSTGYSARTPVFGSGVSVSGVDASTHRLTKESTTVMRTPTEGDSILSANVVFTDTDDDLYDNFIVALVVGGVTVAKEMTHSNSGETVYGTLNYSGYVGKNKTITITVTAVSSAASFGLSYSGSLTCVNYQ